MIRAVTLDLWNTIFVEKSFSNYRSVTVQKHLEDYGISRELDEVQAGFNYAKKLFEIDWIENYRQMSLSTRIKHILDYLKASLPQESIDQIISEFYQVFMEYPPEFKEGVIETIESLQPEYKLGIISDTGITHGKVIREHLDSQGILEHFTSTIFSDEIGYSKPHKIPFQKALKELDAKPDEVVHVGDLLRTDVAGAKNVGIKAVWVKMGDQTPENVEPDYTITTMPELLNYLNQLK